MNDSGCSDEFNTNGTIDVLIKTEPNSKQSFTDDDGEKKKRDYGVPQDHRNDTQSSKSAQDDENIDDCYVCGDGGELICCDYCEKAFHMECHIPRLYEIPEGKWKCCECRATSMKRKYRCGECRDCLQSDCGLCRNCLDMKKFGGDGRIRKKCLERKPCNFMRYAPPEKKRRLKYYSASSVGQESTTKLDNSKPVFSEQKQSVEKEANKRQLQITSTSNHKHVSKQTHSLDQPYGSDEMRAWEKYLKLKNQRPQT